MRRAHWKPRWHRLSLAPRCLLLLSLLLLLPPLMPLVLLVKAVILVCD